MEVKQATIFLCYARKDMGKVNELYQQLKHRGFSPWMDIHDLQPGEDWLEVITEQIERSTFFLACLSNHSINRQGTLRQEINEALDVAKGRVLYANNVFIIPVRLEEIEAESLPRKLRKYHWVDLFAAGGIEKLTGKMQDEMIRSRFISPLLLRIKPIDDLSEDDVKDMLMKYDFPDQRLYSKGKRIHPGYERKVINDHQVVIDRTTGLMWQQSNSPKRMHFKEAPDYIAQLNLEKFAGFDDWRLPTLEELMSLMEPAKIENGRYINSLFDKKESWIWSADQLQQASEAWYVVFLYGYCMHSDVSKPKVVRAVRSTQSD